MDISQCLPTADDLLAAYPQLKDKQVTTATVTAWINQAATIVSLSGALQASQVTPAIVDQAISLYAAHLGALAINQLHDETSIAMAGVTIQHADRSSVGDPFIGLYNDLLDKLGIGVNKVQFL